MFSDHSYGGHDALTDNAVVVNGTKYKLSDDAKIICGFYWDNAFYTFDMSTKYTNEMNQLFPGKLVCVSDGHNYHWGVSLELLVLILIVHIAWSTSMFLMWIEATTHSLLVNQGRKMSMWKAILDLAQPLLMCLDPNDGLLDPDQFEECVRSLSSVHYEAKRDGGFVQDIHLVSSSDAAPAKTEIAGE
jgi:hypothetical protein